MHIGSQANETAQDVAVRFAQVAAVKLLEAEAGDLNEGGGEFTDDDEDVRRSASHRRRRHKTETQSLLSSEQKKDAKERARKRLEEIEKQLVIAKSNFVQLGGRLEDITADSDGIDDGHQTIKYDPLFCI